MSVTLSTFGSLFLPLSALVFLFKRLWILPLLCAAAVLQAPALATVRVAGLDLGISPFLAMSLLVALDLLMRGPAYVRTACVHALSESPTRQWLWFIAATALGGLLLPFVFAGTAVLAPLNKHELEMVAEPLVFSINHIAQVGQALLIGVLLLWVSALRRDPDLAHRLFVGVAIATALAAAIGLQQRLAWNGLVPLGSQFWASNPTYAQNWETLAGVVPRVSWPFVEPSYASAFFAAAFGGFFSLFLADLHRHKALAAAMVCLFALANTLGATGVMAVLVYVAVVSLICLIAVISRRRWAGGLFYRFCLSALAATCVCLVGYLVLRHYDLLDAARSAAENVMAGRSQTVLGDIRMQADLHSWRLISETWGLGVGLGSHRGSSFLLSLAAVGGVLSVVLLVLALTVQFTRLVQRAVRRAEPPAVFFLGGGATAMVAAFIAIPDQNWPVLWIFLLGGLASVISARKRSGAITQPPQPLRHAEGREGAIDPDIEHAESGGDANQRGRLVPE